MRPAPSVVPQAPLATAPVLAAAAFAVALAVPLTPSAGRSASAPIFLDGTFVDWTAPPQTIDVSGDGGGSGIDFREVSIANDGSFLFIRFQTTAEIGIQADGNNLVLDLDTDMNAGTGLAVGGIGAELEWNFGNRSGCFYPSGSCVTVNQNSIRLRALPSVTATMFEIAIARDVLPNGVNPLFPGPSFRLLLRDAGSGGDRVPDAGGLAYTFDATPVPDPTPTPFARSNPTDVRVVTWNVPDLESGAGFDAGVTPSADRVLSAISPDIVCFQEVYTPTAAATRTLIEGMLPAGAPWYAAKQNDCIVVSRYPILQSFALDGNLGVVLDSDAALGTDLVLVCAHLPCCTSDAGRQSEIDRIMAFFRDAMTAGGVIDVPVGTAFLIAGDLNLVGFSQQLRTLLTGDIVNQGTFGADFDPDWDGTALADVVSSQTERRFAYTWRNDGSSFGPGRLDFHIFNDSVLQLGNHYSVYSPEMSPAQLAATGIQANDVTIVADHLPHVADYRPASGSTGVPPVDPRRIALLPGSTVGRDEIRFVLELGYAASVELSIFDVHGRMVRSLTGGGPSSFAAGRHPLVWDGRTDDGARASAGVYLARVVARGTESGAQELSARGKWILLR